MDISDVVFAIFFTGAVNLMCFEHLFGSVVLLIMSAATLGKGAKRTLKKLGS